MHLPLVLLGVSSHILHVDEVACYFIHGEGFSEALCGLLVFCNAEDADFLSGFWGETAFLLEGESTAVIGLRHDCGLKISRNDVVDVSKQIRMAVWETGARTYRTVFQQV